MNAEPQTQIPADTAKFDAFNIVDVSYKEVNHTQIPASIFVPKDVKPGKHPLLVRWHGGGLITGHRLYPDWFADWILDLALSRNAIVICPDYRLLPEAKGLDILQDIRDFYSWLLKPESLFPHLPEGVTVDLDNILVTGESAGGWIALQSTYISPARERVAAAISQYPMIAMRDPHYTGDYEKQLFDPPAPQLDRSILRNYLSQLKGDEVVTSAFPPDRVPLVLSALQQGRFGTLFGDDESLYPIEVMDVVHDLPPTWILHGQEDNIVPIEGTYQYVEKVKKRHPSAKLHLSYQPGMHGFDNHPAAKLEDDWVKEGVNFIEYYWPKC